MVWIASQSVNIDDVIPPVNIQEESSDSDEEFPCVDILNMSLNLCLLLSTSNQKNLNATPHAKINTKKTLKR